MNIGEHEARVSTGTAALGSRAAAVTSPRRWAVVNRDSPHQEIVLVTRWRWYAGWWAAWLRSMEGDDMRIVPVR